MTGPIGRVTGSLTVGDNMFQCPNCDKEFEKEWGLRVHNRLAHKEPPLMDILDTIRKVKGLAKEVGGMEKLKELTEVLT